MRPPLDVSLPARSVARADPCEFTAVTCGESANTGKSFGSTSVKLKGMFSDIVPSSVRRVMQYTNAIEVIRYSLIKIKRESE